MSDLTTAPEITGTYTIDPAHTHIGFVARHAMVTKVRGAFNDFEGSLVLNTADPAQSSAEITIDVASVDTRQEQRDAHLRANDFFDAPNFPKIKFKSTNVEQVDSENYKVTGDLTIKETTKPVTIDFELAGASKDPFGNERVGFEGKTVINRTEWGVNFNAALETGGLLVSEKITLELEVSAIKAQ